MDGRSPRWIIPRNLELHSKMEAEIHEVTSVIAAMEHEQLLLSRHVTELRQFLAQLRALGRLLD